MMDIIKTAFLGHAGSITKDQLISDTIYSLLLCIQTFQCISKINATSKLYIGWYIRVRKIYQTQQCICN